MSCLPTVALIGASGHVGRQVIAQLLEGDFDPKSLMTIGSSSCGSSMEIRGHTFLIQDIQSLDHCTMAILATPSSISHELLPLLREKADFILDASSAFRMHPNVPLICFPVNGHKLSPDHQLYAHANCIASPVSILLNALGDACLASMDHVFVNTYQSMSGAGWKPMETLKTETLDFLHQKAFDRHTSMAFNLRPQIGDGSDHGQTGEEIKVQEEINKILGRPLNIHAHCVRVPTLQGHGMSVWVSFGQKVELRAIQGQIEASPHLCLDATTITPREVVGQNKVHVGRLFQTDEKHVHFWLCSDNLRRGASTDLVESTWALLRQRAL